MVETVKYFLIWYKYRNILYIYMDEFSTEIHVFRLVLKPLKLLIHLLIQNLKLF